MHEPSSSLPALDEILPEPEHRSRHERFIPASPDAVWDALQRLGATDMPIAAVLIALRMLPALLAGRARGITRPVAFVARPPIPVLASEPPRGLVLAGVRQPWRLLGEGDPPPRLDRDTFVAFAEPGWVKLAMDFRLAPEQRGTRVSTETRIRATDPRARRAFDAYWLVVSRPSGLVRRQMLEGLARLAT